MVSRDTFTLVATLEQSWTRVGSIRGSGRVEMSVGRVGSKF